MRHGEVRLEGPERVYGDLEMPLSERGVAQLEAAAESLAREPLTAVFASDLSRARIGAEAIARRHGLPVRIERGLREIHRGAWAGKTWEEVERGWPGGPALFVADPVGYRGHGGETLGDIDRRAAEAVQSIVENCEGGAIAIVSHSWVLRCLLARALGASVARALQLPVDCGSVSTLVGDASGWLVASMNRRARAASGTSATG